jgi:hypothetical protein
MPRECARAFSQVLEEISLARNLCRAFFTALQRLYGERFTALDGWRTVLFIHRPSF